MNDHLITRRGATGLTAAATSMSTKHWTLYLILMASVVAASIVVNGCATNPQGYSSHQGYQGSHHWSDSEMTFYVQWEGDTHRTHQDYDRRNADEQQQYWSWRQHNGG